MKVIRFTLAFINLLIITIFYCCVPDEVMLKGDIIGQVSDAGTNDPLPDAFIDLYHSGNVIDTAVTGNDGSYLINNISPGMYDLRASKAGYKPSVKSVTIAPAKLNEVNIVLSGIPVYQISDLFLDFGFDSTEMSFTISNSGNGKFRYGITASQDWIEIHPSTGEVDKEPDTITVTIDRSGLSDYKHQERVTINFYIGDDQTAEKVDVFVNGLADQEGNYYGIVTIGTQTWMAENLNTGEMLNVSNKITNNHIVEKYCYDNKEANCDLYGGLYIWSEMMDWNTGSDAMSQVRGICPAGWHIPDSLEWVALAEYLGGMDIAGGKLKDTGDLWTEPNTGATNEAGFNALPGGYSFGHEFKEINSTAVFWTSTAADEELFCFYMGYNNIMLSVGNSMPSYPDGFSLRCLKDQ